MRATSFCVMLLALWALSDLASADTVRVDCVPPTARTDGTMLLPSEIDHYTLVTERLGGEVAMYTLGGCGVELIIARSGRYTATMATVDTDGRSSVPSNAVEFLITGASPGEPGNVRITRVFKGPGE